MVLYNKESITTRNNLYNKLMKKFLLFLVGMTCAVALPAQETAVSSSGTVAGVSPLIQTADAEVLQALQKVTCSADKLPSLDEKLSVQDCVRIALANNPQVIEARLGVESAAVSLSSAKNALLPKANASVSGGAYSTKSDNTPRYNSDSVNSAVKVNLEISALTDIGRNIRTQQLQLQRAILSLQEKENKVIASIKSDYYSLLAAQRAVAIRTQSRDLYQEQYERTKAFYDQGLRPKVDVTTAEVDLNNAILSLIRAKNLVKTLTAALANEMGVTRAGEFILDDSIEIEPLNLTFEQALTKAYENRPDVRSSKTALQISQIKLRQAKADYWPTFSMGAAFVKDGSNFHFDSDQLALSASIEIPLFNGFQTRNAVKQAQLNNLSALNSDRSLTNTVFLEVQNAFIKLNEAAESIPVAESNVEKSKENMELAQGRYNEGIGDIISLKDAQVAYTDAELSLLTAWYDYGVAMAELKKAIGTY